MQELQLKESVANKTSTSHQEPKSSLVTSDDLSCSDNLHNPTDSQSQNTSENNPNNSSVLSGKRPNDTANLNPAKRASQNISTEKNENNPHHIPGSNSRNHSTLFNRENFSGLSLFSTTPQTNTNPTSEISTNNLSSLTTLFHLPSNPSITGTALYQSPFLFGSSQSKPDDAVDYVATTKIKPQPTAILESIIKHKSFDTGKPRQKKLIVDSGTSPLIKMKNSNIQQILYQICLFMSAKDQCTQKRLYDFSKMCFLIQSLPTTLLNVLWLQVIQTKD